MAGLLTVYFIGYILSLSLVIFPYFIGIAKSPEYGDIFDYIVCIFFAFFFSLIWFIILPIVAIAYITKFIVEL